MQLNPTKHQSIGMRLQELFETYIAGTCWSNEPASRKEIMGYYKRRSQVVPIEEETHSDIESEEDDDDEIQRAKDRNTQLFIRNARRKHGRRNYGYTCTYLKDNKTPVKVKCYIHGKFKILPHAHLIGGGCKYCKQEAKFDQLYNDHRTKSMTTVKIQNVRFEPEQ